MNHLIGLFTLADSSAEELLWNRQPWTTCTHYRGLPIGPLELAVLAVLLGIGDHERAIAGFSLLAGESQDMPWVIGIPPDLGEALASLNSRDVTAAADLWAQHGDMASRFSVDDLEQYLTGVRDFLRSTPVPHALLVVAHGPQDPDGPTSHAQLPPRR